MATQTTTFASGINGLVLCEYTYDDVTHVMQALIGINNDDVAHTVSLSALDPVTLAEVASGTQRLNHGANRTFNISALNLVMVSHVSSKTGQTYFTPPYILSAAIS